MKLKILNGILIIDILSILLILSILFIPSTVIRVILGLPFLLFFPGYTLVAALFAKKDGINNIERIALSIGMSIAVAGLIGVGLNYTPLGIRLEPVLYSVTIFIITTSAIALIRRIKILKTHKFITEYSLNLPAWGEGTFNKALSIILLISIFAAIGVLVYTAVAPKTGENFSEFYILGINGETQAYPIEYVINKGQITRVIYSNGTVDFISKLGAVTLGIVNHQQQTAVYYVKLTIDDEPVTINFGGVFTDTLGPIELRQGERWENTINITPQHIKDNQKVELLLFKGTETKQENSLHWWITVQSARSDATLSNLAINPGTISPAFTSGTVNYIASVGNRVSSIIITPMVNESHAIVTVNGNPVNSNSPSGAIDLSIGDNIISVVVTAEDTSTKTYTVTVTRRAQSSGDATLSNITISSGILIPAFTSSTVSYTVSVGNVVRYIEIIPWVNDRLATATVNGIPVINGQSSGSILLNVGNKTITIVVTAEDTTTKTYTVTVTRAPSP